MGVELRDIREAAERIADRVVATPTRRSRTLSEITGAHVHLKFENQQFTGSFKDRGALVKLLSLAEEQRRRGVIAMSAGNHAQAVAHHAHELGIPAVIVMPRFTPNVKIERTRRFGAEIQLHGQGLEEAGDYARSIASERGLALIHPYDDERIVAGQGTIALEMLEEFPDLEILVVPIGGGGLISGIALGARGLDPDVRIVGVESSRYPSMLRALHGEPAECGPSTVAEGIAVKAPGQLTLPIIREHVEEILLVDEGDVEQAILRLLEVEKTVAEGAGAAALAAVLRHPDRFADRKVGVVISGGNIDLPILSWIIERGMVRSGRQVQLRVEIRDVPGTLADVARRLGEADADIVQVQHQRAFTNLPLQSAELDFVVQTRGREHVREILRALEEGGYRAYVLHKEGSGRPGGDSGPDGR